MQYPPTELVLDAQGNVYHLGLAPEDIADTIILVGDQGRVELVASYFDTVQHTSQHREFYCITGTYKGKRITALSTGIGTDNIDITINELDALANIDLDKREDKPEHKSLRLIRIGTCGILHPEVPVHSYILSTHAFGIDNVAHFYEVPFDAEETALNKEISDYVSFPENVRTYISKASDSIVSLLDSDKTENGITVTSSGFYGPQGRQLRLKNRTGHINDLLSSFQSDSYRITNFEMESSALFSLGRALGHECGTICLGIANRPNKEFSSGYKDAMKELILYVLDRV
ncbi:nucleoside phosphorylase [Crocinitomicaceae bacterium]|nr:nucleoside phosphorylase [Crocinitomicaceae bacterium]MDC0257648.1 nucleoside phosphorylase [Crocinitomicaceae bacterium]